MLRKTELKEQKKMMSKWKSERDDLIKAQRAESDTVLKACNNLLDKTHKDRYFLFYIQQRHHYCVRVERYFLFTIHVW